jgi:hypothetical protein
MSAHTATLALLALLLLPACATTAETSHPRRELGLSRYGGPGAEVETRDTADIGSSSSVTSRSELDDGAWEEARRAEADRVLETLWSVAGNTNALGAEWEFRFWSQGGALTLLSLRRTVQAEHRHGDARPRWRIVAAHIVEPPPLPAEVTDIHQEYRGLHESILIAFQEETREVAVLAAGFTLEQIAYSIVGGLALKGAWVLIGKGAPTILSVLSKGGKAAVSWFRNLLVRTPAADRELLLRLWMKAETQGIKALTEVERKCGLIPASLSATQRRCAGDRGRAGAGTRAPACPPPSGSGRCEPRAPAPPMSW